MHKTLALTPFIDAGWSSLSPSPLDFERNPDDFSCELPLASGFAWECDRVDGAVMGLSTGAVAVVGLVTAVAGRCFALWWAELGRLDAALDSTSASVSAILHASWQKQKQKVSQYHSLKNNVTSFYNIQTSSSKKVMQILKCYLVKVAILIEHQILITILQRKE